MKPSWLLSHRRPRRRRRSQPRQGVAGQVGRALLGGATYPFTYQSELLEVAGDSRRPLTFRRSDTDSIEAELYSHLIPIKRRIWAQRALLLLIRGLVLVGGIYFTAALLNFAAVPVPQTLWSALATFVSVLALLLIVQQRVSYSDAARVLDRRLGLNQVIGTAVELTGQNADSRVARLQTRRATESLRRLESRDAVKIGLPRRDLRVLAALSVMTLLFTYLATLHIAWPGTPPAEQLSLDPTAEMVADAPYEPTFFEGSGSEGMLDPQMFSSSLGEYRLGLEGQNLTDEEIQQRIAEIQAALAQRAEQLSRQRAALGELADALSDNSATSEAADSIRRGDYQRAAQQLSELGKQSSQLSQRARQDLARRLNEAAARVAPNNPELAQRMRRAAQQLQSGDQAQSEQALKELSEGVTQAGERVQQLADNTNFDPSTMDPDQMGRMPSDLSAEDLAALQNYESTGEGGEMGDMGDMGQFGEGFGEGMMDPQGMGPDGGPMARSDALGSQGAGAGSAPGGGAETGRGGQGAAQQGRVLELRGRPTGDGSGTLDQGDKVPLVSTNDGSVTGSGVGQARSVIVDPLSVRGEQNFVPWEKRQIVKDFFTGTR